MEKEKAEFLKKILGVIDTEVKRDMDVAGIKKKVAKAMNYSEGYIDRKFKTIIGKSLYSFIKMKKYIYIYENMCRNKMPVNQRVKINGISYFPYYIKRDFGVSVSEISDEDLDRMNDQITKEEFDTFDTFAQNSDLIESYDLENGIFKVHFVMKNLLSKLLMCKTYIIPEVLMVVLKWKEIPLDEKKLWIILFIKTSHI